MDLKTLLNGSALLYQKQFGERVRAYIIQIRGDSGVPRAQFLALVIEDRGSDRWVALRLSTMRRLVAWLVKWTFVPTARRLTELEKRIMDGNWRRHLETHRPRDTKTPDFLFQETHLKFHARDKE
jgi:hypothetical protein